METILALDLGTTNCKVLAVGVDGLPRSAVSEGYMLSVPHPGWAEQDPRAVWSAARHCLKQVAATVQAADLVGICLSGAMHSLLPVDGPGQPLANATTWADGRAVGQAASLRAKTDPQALYQRTGCPLQPLYHPARLRWYLEEAPELSARTARFCSIKEWVLFQLTGVWAVDLSLASATGLLDIHSASWDSEALALGGIGTERLSELISPFKVVGGLLSACAAEFGLPPGLPVVAGAADGGLANLGAGALRPGQTVITVGTSAAIRRMVKRPWLDPLARTWCYLLAEERWYSGGAINNAGLAIEWVREVFYPDVSGPEGYNRLFADAQTVLPGAEGLLILPYLTGERTPHWNPAARAAMFGLGLQHTRAHIARAVLEGVAYCLADVWEALGEPEDGALQTGSIARSPFWCQMLADILETRLSVMDAADASALGAAVLGLSALRKISRLEDAPVPAAGAQVLPDPSRQAAYRLARQQFQTLYNRTFVL